MGTISVPAPPRSSYNQNRRVSDLLLNQLKHFQHVEMKHGDLGIDPETARNIHTEGGAALYIAAITKALRAKGLAKATAAGTLTAVPGGRAKKASKAKPLALAAAGSESPEAGPAERNPAHGSASVPAARKP